MKTLISEKIQRILKNKKRLEKILGVKIENRGKEVYIDGKPEDEYIAEKVIDALDFGFPFSTAISIKEEDFHFEILNIKNYTRRKDFVRIKARLIGKKGKTLKTLSELTKCNFELKGYDIGIIGSPECIKTTQEAIIYLIQGSKHANVYTFLEKNQIKSELDLGLKE